jgi:cobalamin biosynthesis protein CobD/CbiB
MSELELLRDTGSIQHPHGRHIVDHQEPQMRTMEQSLWLQSLTLLLLLLLLLLLFVLLLLLLRDGDASEK